MTYDPEQPNLYGYPYRHEPENLWAAFCWWMYGPGVVAVFLHREQSIGGRAMNFFARKILNHLYTP